MKAITIDELLRFISATLGQTSEISEDTNLYLVLIPEENVENSVEFSLMELFMDIGSEWDISLEVEEEELLKNPTPHNILSVLNQKRADKEQSKTTKKDN